MAKDKAKSGPGTAEVIDFSQVKEGGNFNKKRLKEGDYTAIITKVEDTKSNADGIKMWLFTIATEKGGGTYPYYCKFQANQLWKIRNLMVAAGLEVPKKKLKVDPSRLVGKTIGITLVDGEYEGKKQSEVDAVFEAGEVSNDDDEVEGETTDEKPKKEKKGKKDKKKKSDDTEMESISTDGV